MIASPIDEIKNRLDIVEVIQGYIRLKKAGANYQALCPFHSEKKPSLFVSPARQIWHCFGCNRGGSIFNFVMEIEGVEFGDALRILAQKAGVELKRQDPKLRSERQRLYEILELATKFFEKQLRASKTGQAAKKYLLQRGLNQESIQKWRLGLAPNSWQGLSDFLVGQGYKKEEIEKAGLVIKKEDGNFYDRFRGRIIFPVFDLNSQMVGFTGRIFKFEREPKEKILESPAEPAKYINTPATLLYDKSRVLYGLDKAKVAIRKKDSCILVEGNIDAILSQQAGQENTVATSGTALTPYQLKILRRYSENLFTAFDMDIAGDTATKRGVDLAQSQGFNIKIIIMPKGKDPADVVLESPKKWPELIGQAKSMVEFYFETAFAPFLAQGKNLTPEAKKAIAKILLPVLKRIPNKIEQSHWIQKLAQSLQVKEEDIAEELKKTTFQKFSEFLEIKESLPEREAKPKSRKEMIEERMAALLLKSPEKFNLIEGNIINYFSPGIKEIVTLIKEHPAGKIEGKISPELRDLFNYLLLKSEVEEVEDVDQELKICGQEIQCLEKKYRLNLISQEIKKAEEDRNLEKVKALLKEFNTLSQEPF
jgi:DNA primase